MHNSGKIHEGFGNITKTLVNVNKFDAVTLQGVTVQGGKRREGGKEEPKNPIADQ